MLRELFNKINQSARDMNATKVCGGKINYEIPMDDQEKETGIKKCTDQTFPGIVPQCFVLFYGIAYY